MGKDKDSGFRIDIASKMIKSQAIGLQRIFDRCNLQTAADEVQARVTDPGAVTTPAWKRNGLFLCSAEVAAQTCSVADIRTLNRRRASLLLQACKRRALAESKLRTQKLHAILAEAQAERQRLELALERQERVIEILTSYLELH